MIMLVGMTVDMMTTTLTFAEGVGCRAYHILLAGFAEHFVLARASL